MNDGSGNPILQGNVGTNGNLSVNGNSVDILGNLYTPKRALARARLAT